MRTSLLTLGFALIVFTSCSRKQAPAAYIFTRQDLLGLKSWDTNSHFYYIGTKDGFDWVARASLGFPTQAIPEYNVRMGELHIVSRHEITQDIPSWQSIGDMIK
jgi:hypothetical protein